MGGTFQELVLLSGLCRSEAIVLKSHRLKEADLIAVLYTRSFGRLSGVAKGARRPRSQFMGRLEPLSLGEVVFFARAGGELVSIDSIDLVQSCAQKTADYRCLMQLSFLAELVANTTPEREPNDPLFRLLRVVLPQLTQPATADLAQLYFEIWHLKLAGFFPNHRHCHHCGQMLESAATVTVASDLRRFLCGQCSEASSHTLSREALDLLDGICRCLLSDLYARVPEPAPIQELGGIVEPLLERSFERTFQSLRLIPNTA